MFKYLVVTYYEYSKGHFQHYETIWDADTAEIALNQTLESFDEIDRKNIVSIEVYAVESGYSKSYNRQ
jgi:hypothetical protein